MGLIMIYSKSSHYVVLWSIGWQFNSFVEVKALQLLLIRNSFNVVRTYKKLVVIFHKKKGYRENNVVFWSIGWQFHNCVEIIIYEIWSSRWRIVRGDR